MNGPKRMPRIQARLDQWAIWAVRSASGGGGGGTTISYLMDMAAGRRVSGDTVYECVVPVDEIECSRTDAAVRQLPVELRQAVSAWHCGTDTLEACARRLGVVRGTLHRRLCQADMRVYAYLYPPNRPHR